MINTLVFNPGHHSNVSFFQNGKLQKIVEEEKLSHIKYDNLPFLSIDNIIKEFPIDSLVITGTDPVIGEKINPLIFLPGNGCDEKHVNQFVGETGALANLINKLNFKYHRVKNNLNFLSLGNYHHDCHISSAFYGSGFDKALGVVIDGLGSFVIANIVKNTEAGCEFNGKESVSVYECNSKGFFPIYKELVSNVKHFNDSAIKNININSLYGDFNVDLQTSSNLNIGMVYELVCKYLGFTINDSGKIMGLAPYGSAEKLNFEIIEGGRGIPELFSLSQTITNFDEDKSYSFSFKLPKGEREIDNFVHSEWHYNEQKINDLAKNLAAKVQEEYENKLYSLLKKHLLETNYNKVVLGGGCALNVVANYKVLKKLRSEKWPDLSIYVDPISHDGGTSLGAGLFYNLITQQVTADQVKLETLYLGNQYDIDVEAISKKYDQKLKFSNTTSEEVASLLSNNKLIAIYQGRSEVGPRALGNRSILYNPVDVNGKKRVNEVKKREWFRPFAATVLNEHSKDWFDMCGMEESPFMMFAIDVLKEKINKIPAVTHVDGTCRVQTLTRTQNLFFYDLIDNFFKLTGVPLLLNTSFNLAGDTMVETPEDAISTLLKSSIDYVYFPEIGKLAYKNEN